MLKSEVVEYFGSHGKVAKALGIKRQAVQAWAENVPPLRAYQLRELMKPLNGKPHKHK
jgi:hypothetical protein